MQQAALKHLKLTDMTAPAWDRFKLDIELRISALQIELEGKADERTSDKIRGRIAELRSILVLADPNPSMSGASDN